MERGGQCGTVLSRAPPLTSLSPSPARSPRSLAFPVGCKDPQGLGVCVPHTSPLEAQPGYCLQLAKSHAGPSIFGFNATLNTPGRKDIVQGWFHLTRS